MGAKKTETIQEFKKSSTEFENSEKENEIRQVFRRSSQELGNRIYIKVSNGNLVNKMFVAIELKKFKLKQSKKSIITNGSFIAAKVVVPHIRNSLRMLKPKQNIQAQI